jgi:hypothetical protein
MNTEKEIVIRYGYTNGENWIFQEFDITEIENGAAYEAVSDNALLKNYKLKTRDRWSVLTDKNGVKVFEGDEFINFTIARPVVIFRNGAFGYISGFGDFILNKNTYI